MFKHRTFDERLYFYSREQRAKRACLHAHLATAARVKYPAALQRYKFDAPLLAAGSLTLRTVPVGTCFQAGEAVLKLTQIGKECHSHCEIYKAMGDCIMPREGVFTEVIKGGRIKTGDEITMLPLKKDRPFTGAVITLSDKGHAGEREDESGPLIREHVAGAV